MTAMTQLLEMRLMGMTAQCIDIEGLYIFRLRGAMGLPSGNPSLNINLSRAYTTKQVGHSTNELKQVFNQ